VGDLLGRVVRLQIQRTSLKYDRQYDPVPLLSVPEVVITARGVVGAVDRGWMLDAHHADHPFPRGRGLRPLSIGFTSHYGEIDGRFGPVPLGIGGENMIVSSDRRWTEEDLGGGVVVNGVELVSPRVAAPCLEFTSYLLGLPERAPRDDVTGELEFLDGGTRGFLLDVGRVREPLRVAVGDEVTLIA
jgi:hypothetical protein